jgi:aminomethyltransferase
MTVVGEEHEAHGADFRELADGRRAVEQYRRPERTARAVRNGVGIIEMGYGVVAVTGEDRHDFVDDAVSNRVPATDGEGCYALLLDPQGTITTDMYVFNAGERLLVLTPPGQADPLVEDWSGKVFIQDVEIRNASAEFGVFGVHGPTSTEKVASVLHGSGSPDSQLSFIRGSMGDAGVTVIRTDGLLGEEGYEVVCTADAGEEVFGTLLTRGLNAVPFGYGVYETLALEAGTPLFATELEGQIPNVAGIRNALDFEKGCYVGQEVVSKVENRGRPSQRLVGLLPDVMPESGAAVFDGDSAVGEVTRAVDSTTLEGAAAMAYVDFGVEAGSVTVRVEGEEVPAEVVDLPFHDGSDRSARIPEYIGD